MRTMWRGWLCRLLTAYILILASKIGAEESVAPECKVVYAPGKFALQTSASRGEGSGEIGIVPNGFVALSDKTEIVHGVDVSKWQDQVDFEQLVRCGARFSYVRLSAGTKGDSELKYRPLWGGARSQGLLVGPYHNLTLIQPKGLLTRMSKEQRADLQDQNVRAAEEQATIFKWRLGEMLRLDLKPKDEKDFGGPYLPITLDASLRPNISGGEEDRKLFGAIYYATICSWMKSVLSDPHFAGQTIVLFTTPFVYHDFHLGEYHDFQLAEGSCALDKLPVWISYRTLDGDRAVNEKDPEKLAAIRALCMPDGNENRCILHQYTPFGGFAVHRKSAGLDLDRFYGNEDALKKFLQQAKNPTPIPTANPMPTPTAISIQPH